MDQGCDFDIFNLELFGHRIAVSTISAISSITAIVLNSLVLYSIWKTPSLHKPSYILIANLALTDLIAGAIVQPLQIIFNVTVLMKWQHMFCLTWIGALVFGYLVGTVSLYTMVLISVDRLLAIKLKNKYQGIVTLKRISSAVIFGWIAGGFAVPAIFLGSNVSMSKLIIFATAYQTLMMTILTVCYSMAYHSLKKVSWSVSSGTVRNGTRNPNLQVTSSISSRATRNEEANSEQHQLSRTARNRTSPEQHLLSSSSSSSITAQNKVTYSEQDQPLSSSSSTARNKVTNSEQDRPSSSSSSTARNKVTNSEQDRPSSSSSSTAPKKVTNSEQHRPSSSLSSNTARNKVTNFEQHRPSSLLSSNTARNKVTNFEQHQPSSLLSSNTARNQTTNSQQHRLFLRVLNRAPEETATSGQRTFNVIKYRRSLNTMLLVLLCMLLSYLPLAFVAILLATTMKDGLNFGEDNSSVLMYKLTTFSETFVLIASSVNPFLYIWRLKDLRQAVFLKLRKIFRR